MPAAALPSLGPPRWGQLAAGSMPLPRAGRRRPPIFVPAARTHPGDRQGSFRCAVRIYSLLESLGDLMEHTLCKSQVGSLPWGQQRGSRWQALGTQRRSGSGSSCSMPGNRPGTGAAGWGLVPLPKTAAQGALCPCKVRIGLGLHLSRVLHSPHARRLVIPALSNSEMPPKNLAPQRSVTSWELPTSSFSVEDTGGLVTRARGWSSRSGRAVEGEFRPRPAGVHMPWSHGP